MVVITPVAAKSTEIHVYPGDSIQVAVDAASLGDTIIVHGGVYHQSVKIDNDDITLKGKGAILDGTLPADPGTTFLGEPPGPMFGIWLSTGVSGVTITGFEIRAFEERGIAIWLERDSHDNDIIDNEFTGSTTVGIMVSTSHNNLIEKNKVSNDVMYGIVLESASDGNKVIDNKIADSGVVGIVVDENSIGNLIEKTINTKLLVVWFLLIRRRKKILNNYEEGGEV